MSCLIHLRSIIRHGKSQMIFVFSNDVPIFKVALELNDGVLSFHMTVYILYMIILTLRNLFIICAAKIQLDPKHSDSAARLIFYCLYKRFNLKLLTSNDVDS